MSIITSKECQEPTTVKMEQDGMISFLDLKIHRHANETSIGIYRKPTFTDVIIPAGSNHPKQHKTSSLKYMLHRANKLPLSNEEHAKELSIINTIATNNGYDIKTIMITYNRYKNKCNRLQHSQNKEKKWRTKFTYFLKIRKKKMDKNYLLSQNKEKK
jgi:hypothetical protein